MVKAGGWEAFNGTTTKGKPVCGMSSSPKDQYFGLKHFSGDTTFTIQIGKSSWRIENGSKQKLTMRLEFKQALERDRDRHAFQRRRRRA